MHSRVRKPLRIYVRIYKSTYLIHAIELVHAPLAPSLDDAKLRSQKFTN